MKSPAEIDASGITEIEITFRDLTFTVPASPDGLPFSFLKASREGDHFACVGYVLGDEQFELFQSHDPTIREANELMLQWAHLVGAESPGE